MPRCHAALLFLALLPCAHAAAQGALTVQPLDTPPPMISELLPSPADVTDVPPLPPVSTGDSPDVAEPACQTSHHLTLGEFWGYRISETWTSWIVGNGDQYGDVSFGVSPYVGAGVKSGFRPGLGVHFLAGPDRTDMPPVLLDFSLAYQKRDVIGDLAYDVACSVIAASDFEGSSHDGVRFPAHAVGYLAFTETVELVFGADFLDREDIRVLPVGGVLWRPDAAVRIELVFPSPRIDIQLTDTQRLYLRGGLGGGTWAVERDSELDDLATYYDLQVAIGLGTFPCQGSWSSLEIAYLFDRKLQYTSGPGDYHPDATVMIRSVTKY